MKINALAVLLASSAAAFAAEPTRLTNISVRAPAGGSDTLIVGFSVGGSGNKPVLLRAVGPTLASFGVTDAVTDPQLQVFQGSTSAGANNDWGGGGDLAARFSALGAFALPATSRDAALVLPLAAGSYSAHVTAPSGGTALVECYDAEPNATGATLRNISARTLVAPGRPLTAGFVLTGPLPKLVLLRGIGPGLAPFGISNPLPNPLLRVFSSSGQLVAQTDDWSGASGSALVLNAVGAFPIATGSRDASSLLALLPGTYTVQVSAVGEESGIGLVEVYDVTFPTPPANVALQPVVNTVQPVTGLSARADTLARLTFTPAVVYPAELRGTGVLGEVVVTFVVTAEGTVTDAVAVTANDLRFANAALDAVRQSRWEPARLDGQPVAVRIWAPFLFPPPAN
jgi:TonB family protein